MEFRKFKELANRKLIWYTAELRKRKKNLREFKIHERLQTLTKEDSKIITYNVFGIFEEGKCFKEFKFKFEDESTDYFNRIKIKVQFLFQQCLAIASMLRSSF